MTAPTPDEAAAMADAETYTRAMAERRKHHGALAAFVAEYDRRAAEIAALRAEVERSTELGQQAIAAEARAVRELEAENAGLRTELLTTQQILAHAERQRDEAEARLAAQQPVIDAAEAWVDWRRRTSQPEGLEHYLWDIQDSVRFMRERAALSGSVEAAGTPPSGTSGHEADTPAEAEWKRRQRGVRTALFGTAEEVQAALAERRAAAEPDDECPACAAANRPRPMRDLAAILRVDAALPDTIDVGNAVAYCAYTQARDALRAAIGIVAQLAPTLDEREVAGTPAAEPAPETGDASA